MHESTQHVILFTLEIFKIDVCIELCIWKLHQLVTCTIFFLNVIEEGMIVYLVHHFVHVA